MENVKNRFETSQSRSAFVHRLSCDSLWTALHYSYFGTAGNIFFVAPGNLFLRLPRKPCLSAGAAKGTAAALAVTAYQRFVTYSPVLASTSAIDTTQQILNFDLYINNIFVNPEIKIVVSESNCKNNC